MIIMTEHTEYNAQEFISLLAKIDTGEVEVEVKLDSDGEEFLYHEGVDHMAMVLLITQQGRPNWENIRELKNNGFNVFPAERDSFGWLTAGIQIRKGVFYFG